MTALDDPRANGAPSIAPDDPCWLSGREGIARVRSRKLSITEWTSACLDRIECLDHELHAWVTWDRDLALETARGLDARLAQGEDLGPLWGVPIGLKDILNTRDFPTQMGSPIWKGFTPGNDARVVERLKRWGATIVGKTTTSEFAVHHPGDTVNPHHFDHTPGTSSSGSVVAVAAGMVPMAVGTQTLGSLIRPASYTGVYAFKPTFGTIPRIGILKTTDSLDQVGFVCRAHEDLRLFFDAMRVHGANHPFSEKMDRLEKTERQYTVGFVRTPIWESVEGYAQQALEDYAAALSKVPGITVREVTLPAQFDNAWDLHRRIYTKALSYYFSKEYTESRDGISTVMCEMIEEGLALSTERYAADLEEQAALSASLDEMLRAEGIDALISPSAKGVAPKGRHSRAGKDAILLWTLCGVPVVGAPLFVGPDRLPFGAQFVAPKYHDYNLLGLLEYLSQEGMIPEGPHPRVDL